jgi:Protein of unknown function (DUF3168)
MTIEEAFVARLDGTAAVTAINGGRIYPGFLPQRVIYPAVVYQLVGNARPSAFGSDTGLARPRYQFDCWAKTMAETVALAAELRKALQRWRQVGPPEVQDTFIIAEIDIPDVAEDLFRRAVDIEVIWREGV